ncbi:MAG TPA: DUF362 domain-containing protein [Blastocatellia bacterium]|nr:DUF362 domain-containing protein [Blastocatellia bacterium]
MANHLNNLTVSIVSGASAYPLAAPFHPPGPYPEYPHDASDIDPQNKVYPMVREAFRLLEMDREGFGSQAWNPLGEIISPGDRVLIKPNFVLHYNASGGPLEAVITHPSIIRAIADYVIIALKGEGEMIIGDAPQMNCDMSALYRATGMDRLIDFLEERCARSGISVQAMDFRQEQTFYRYGIVWARKPLGNGASRAVRVSLGRESFMEEIDSSRLYGADYCRRETVRAHLDRNHEYMISSAVLSSDVVISAPKLKVHRKVGVTLNLKNMVGINTDKNHLAHYRIGPPDKGGDEFTSPRWEDRAERMLSDLLLGTSWRVGKYPFAAWKAMRKLLGRVRGSGAGPAFTYGNWYGNDTAWRMVLDLNRILLFANSEGRLASSPARRYFSVIDGVIGGEGEGPLYPSAYRSGVVLAGFNPVAVDWYAARLMGLDPARIQLYSHALDQMREHMPDFAIERCSIRSNRPGWEAILNSDELIFRFRVPAGWRGRIERYEVDDEPTDVTSTTFNSISQ